MSCYISSNENRFYVETEAAYGQVTGITGANRFPAVKLGTKQVAERAERRDKTGGRTFGGSPAGIRKKTTFQLQTYLTGWDDQTRQPGYGPLFQAAFGGQPQLYSGGVIQAALSATRLEFTAAHGLTSGQAVAFGGELRFVTAIVDAVTIEINAPFTMGISTGSPVGSTITYRLATDLGSASIFDFWESDAIHRILTGAAVDQLSVRVNADFHGFEFKGYASDLLDSSSFMDGQGGMSQFPPEPALEALSYSVVPGHLGQVWLGNSPDRFFTLTDAELVLDNNVDLRSREFGTDGPRCISGGRRNVSLNMSLFQQDNEATRSLYQAARQRSPISAMFQLGQQPGQLFGSYMKSVIPEVPEYDDSESRLQWKFTNCRAQGAGDDELVVAFG
jgi:hypothetical protein